MKNYNKHKTCQILTKWQSGFTLLELLVVISIIGILLGIISFAFSTAQKQGRDARRMQDIKEAQNAFEQYYAINSVYPVGGQIDDAFQGSRVKDPKNNGSYVYAWNSAADEYCVCAFPEHKTGNANSPGALATCDWNSSGAYFCVENQQ